MGIPPFRGDGLASEAFLQETQRELEADAARYAQGHPDEPDGKTPSVIRRALRRMRALIGRDG